MAMNRRSFLKRASHVAVVAGLAWPPRSRSAEPKGAGKTASSLPIVDTHQHLWDLSKFKLRWLSPPLDRSFTPKDYREATQGLNVVQAVYMEVAVPPEQRVQEAEYVIALCQESGSVTRAAVIAGSPADEDFPQYIGRFQGSPCIKGVRGSFSSPEQMSDKQTVRNLHLLSNLGLRFDLNVPSSSLAEAAHLVDQCPDTRFVLDHCGNPDPVAFFPAGRAAPRQSQHSPEQWKRDIRMLGAKANVICKISGLVSRVPEVRLTADDLAPIIHHCLNAFGPDRVVCAGDWPVCLRGMPLRDWINLLKSVVAGRPEQDQRKLFHDNAVRFYDLS
ncbi:MAG: amidohydrolase family protein [Planctomycetes bacterium]|nr:amidohydrolase family protein [Planctomycetota bacterium]